MLTQTSYSSSLLIKDSDGSWVNAADYNAPERLKLLESEDTVLGKLYIPLKLKLESKSNSDFELKSLLDRASALAASGNSVLRQGILLLIDSNSSKVVHLIKGSPERWCGLSPFLMRREKPGIRSDTLSRLCDVLKDPLELIEACRFLGTPTGAGILAEMMGSPLGEPASYALATLPNDEIPPQVLERAKDLIEKYPLLGAIAPKGDREFNDSAMNKRISIERSFLTEGVSFPNRRISINLEDPEEFEAAAEVIRALAIERVKARQCRVDGLKGSELRSSFGMLTTPNGVREALKAFHEIEVPSLFEAFGISPEASSLIGVCLHDRCAVALTDDAAAYDQEVLRWIGKWNWVSNKLKSISPQNILSELGEISAKGVPVPAGEVIGPRGKLHPDVAPDVNSIDIISSISGAPKDEVLIRERAAFERQLPSVGIEIQNFKVSPENFSSWKDYLRSHGVRSSFRPEFGSLVEASLPPCFSIENLDLMMASLEERGFFSNRDLKMALHVSLGIPATEDVKYIALGLMSLFQPEFDPNISEADWIKSLKNLFSKGLIYKNPGTRPVLDEFPHGDHHAEIRVVYVEGCALSEFHEKFRQGILSAQHWGRELAAGVPSDAFLDFKTEVNRAHSASRLNLLDHTWLFGTGDPIEEQTLMLIPLVNALSDYRRAFFDRRDEVDRFHLKVKDAFLSVAD